MCHRIGRDNGRDSLSRICLTLVCIMLGTYSVNPLGIRRDSEAPSRGRMGGQSQRPAQPGLLRSRGTRLFGKVAFGVAAFAMTSGLGCLDRRFRPGRLDPESCIGECRDIFSFDDRFGIGIAARSLAIRYPCRCVRSVRTSMPSSATSNANSADNLREQAAQPEPNPSRPRNLLKPRFPCREPGRSRPIFSPRGSTRRRRRRTAGPCSRRSPIWCRCASRWRR